MTNDMETVRFCKLTNYIPQPGQIVFSVGFPLFKQFACDEKYSPTVYRGRVTKYSEGLLTTDCPVQAGQSGGPVFDTNGDLVALMVSNFKTQIDDRIYPYQNMCIPICDIYDIIEKYTRTNGTFCYMN